jgi:hypothetical protein
MSDDRPPEPRRAADHAELLLVIVTSNLLVVTLVGTERRTDGTNTAADRFGVALSLVRLFPRFHNKRASG